nr:MAG TPA: deoxyribosyltransferase [Caudoviricetes sp.]
MSRGKVYISGPITGIDFGNRFAFSCARNALELCGYEAVDPSEVQLGDDATWADYMRADLKLLLDCDFIYMLEGWENSRGARLERELAENLGIEEIDLDQEYERAKQRAGEDIDVDEYYDLQITMGFANVAKRLAAAISRLEEGEAR